MTDEHLAPGMLVADRYRIGKMLGEGGMGAVYYAEHVRVGRAVAVKVLSSRWSGEEDVARRFRDEARAASAAGHPNIIEVFDAGELPDGRPYLVMEHISGQELYELIQQRGRLDVPRACRIMRDVARALEAAHAAGIIHRDLKTENVMLVERGGQEVVKVLDFGIAANTVGVRATVAGQVMGTPVTMAPEQAKGVPATTAFDVYALGVMLHEALAGTTPFSGRDGLDLLVVKTSEPAASIATVVGDLPEELVVLVDACLAREPGLRPSVREIAERLDDVAQRSHGTGRGTGRTTVLPSPVPIVRRSRRWVLPVVVVSTMLLVGAGAWGLHDRPSEGEPTVGAASAPTQGGVAPAVVSPPPSGLDAGPEPSERPEPPSLEPASPEPAAPPEPPSPEPPSPEPESPEPESPEPESPEPESPEPPGSELPSLDAPKAEPASTSGLCWRTRKQAKQAREAHDWSGVLRHTRDSSCWAGKRTERGGLRTKAFMELGRWSDCIGASRGLGDEQVRKWRRVCEGRQEHQ